MSESANKVAPRIVVLVPTHSRWHHARDALASLSAGDYVNMEIVLIADGCTDGTVENCRKTFPHVTLLEGDGNLWWSGCINRGMRYALRRRCEAIVWMNDDNLVEPATLSEMVASHVRAGKRSVISGRVKVASGDDAGSDEWVGDPPRWHPEFGDFQRPSLADADIEVRHPPGGRGVLIPTSLVHEIGLVDERTFPHYWADHDFHYRAMHAGYRYFISARGVVWNKPNDAETCLQEYSTAWCWRLLFSRRSSLNVATLHRLLSRHLSDAEYRDVFYPFMMSTLSWMASGWIARHPMLHAAARTLRRTSRLLRA